jgi:hypothetical protein
MLQTDDYDKYPQKPFGIYKLHAIFMGIEKINSLYRDVFQLNLLRTTFGGICSPIVI